MKNLICSITNRTMVILLATLSACGGGSSQEVSGSSKNAVASTYSVTGSVNVAPGVLITIVGPVTKSATTDTLGGFSISDLPPGNYTLAATQDGYVFSPAQTEITVSNSNVKIAEIVRIVPDEELSSEDIKRIDAMPESSVPESEVILPNGQSLSDYAKSRGILDQLQEVE